MRLLHVTTTALAIFVFSSSMAYASTVSYDQIYAFGDSLSDIGNINALLGNVPASPPYAEGRFSNGRVWVEYLAEDLGLGPLKASQNGGTNFAYGAAVSGPTIAGDGIFGYINLPSQLDQFRANVSNPSDNALYTLWIGGNDGFAFINEYLAGDLLLSDADTFIDDVVSNVHDVVDGLADSGMNHLLALNVPDLSLVPTVVSSVESSSSTPADTLDDISSLLSDLNDELGSMLHNLAQTRDFNLSLVDIYSGFHLLTSNPQAFGFTNVTDPCWTGSYTDADSGNVCANPEEYVFWDSIHPTTHGHELVATLSMAKLRGQHIPFPRAPVPEPGNLALFLAGFLALAGVVGYRRRVRMQ